MKARQKVRTRSARSGEPISEENWQARTPILLVSSATSQPHPASMTRPKWSYTSAMPSASNSSTTGCVFGIEMPQVLLNAHIATR